MERISSKQFIKMPNQTAYYQGLMELGFKTQNLPASGLRYDFQSKDMKDYIEDFCISN